MNTPQIIMIVLIAIGFAFTLAKHGEPKGDYNIVEWLISVGIKFALLWWGGFWTVG